MKVKVANSSSKKTRNAIKESFAKLLKEKGSIKNITVTELVKDIDITRGTFYTHYDNIYDVAKDLQDELLDVIFNDDIKITSLEALEDYLDMVIDHLRTNEKLYKMILSSDEPLLFMNRLNRMMNKHLSDFMKTRDDKSLTLSITFFVDGAIVLFIKYFRNEINTSLEELNLFIKNSFKKLFIN